MFGRYGQTILYVVCGYKIVFRKIHSDSLSLELTRKVFPTGAPGLCVAPSHSRSFHDRARMVMKEGAWLASIAVGLIYYVIKKQTVLVVYKRATRSLKYIKLQTKVWPFSF